MPIDRFQSKPSPHSSALKIALIYALFSSLWILSSDWMLVQLIRDPVILTRWQTFKGWLFTALSSIALYLLVYRSTTHIQASNSLLNKAYKRLKAEIESLWQAQQNLQVSETRYRLSEERFRTVLHGSSITVFNQDRDLRYTWIYNPALGMDSDSVLGKLDSDLVLPNEAEQLTAIKLNVIECGMGSRNEVLLRTPTGVRCFDLRVEPLRNSTGEIEGITSVVVDITDRKQIETSLQSALSEKDLLLKEIHHRVKNNLQIISGLLQLQANSISDRRLQNLMQECRNRIESMSLLHNSLYSAANVERLDIAKYIKNLVEYLVASYSLHPERIEIHTDVQLMYLSLDAAIPCGLIVNELVSNAIKYAFPNEQEVCIRVGLISNNNRAILTVADNGIGLSEHINWQSSKTLGLSLVHDLATEQLDGQITCNVANGTCFTVEFPLIDLER